MSISYGGYEASYTSAELTQWDTEAMKLGTMGVTIVVSSGDQGVSGFIYQNYPAANAYLYCGYASQFPASSPYVVTVGGTQGTPEVAAQCNQGGTITTGGGFSTYYPSPSYQSKSVSTYIENTNNNIIRAPYKNPSQTYPANAQGFLSGTFNSSNRGYPDVAAWSSYVQVNTIIIITTSSSSYV